MLTIQIIGKITLLALRHTGSFCIFASHAILSIFCIPLYIKQLLKQLARIGFYSIPVVALTTFFSGAVLALQSYNSFAKFSAQDSIATIVVLSITKELSPVLTSLMLAGRVGASIAAEIGTMRVSEQIDALYTLSADPMKYLVKPRLLAIIISLPLLTLMGDVIGVYGGYVVGVYKLGLSSHIYIVNTFKSLVVSDVTVGLIKSLVFALVIGFVSCYNGYFCKNGARGVGDATTGTVVSSSILILLNNYLIANIFFS
ncbi:putative phospholipid ABC transporter permease [Rickettsiales endosymbiont of Paramecium tredecaurelia]|uniref:MlaE family ABC transporter permease n=1 Tax=Candidatus Sarmatiella mevalonica TaxID=2770581 RepID=UPI0019218DCF|nr:ABC transporter permease [Candidatus Sarmatiella mevalonica]MBL3284469.1 putative phospholipid ABC transporter permease [Candidatus Sarmatiella mevalonica]